MEIGAARGQGVDAGVPVPALLVDLHQPDQRRPVGPDQARVHARERMQPVERHRDRRAPAAAAVARHAHVGAPVGRAEARAAVGEDHVRVEEVDRPEVGHRLGVRHAPDRCWPYMLTVGWRRSRCGHSRSSAAATDLAAAAAAADVVVADRVGIAIVGGDRGDVLQQLAVAQVPVAHRMRPAGELVLAPVDHRVIDVGELAGRTIGADAPGGCARAARRAAAEPRRSAEQGAAPRDAAASSNRPGSVTPVSRHAHRRHAFRQDVSTPGSVVKRIADARRPRKECQPY